MRRRSVRRPAEARAEHEARGDEVAESRSGQKDDRAGAEIGSHKEGADEVPRSVQGLVPPEGRAEELGPCADAVPEQSDRPYELEPAMPPRPLGEHGGCEHEADDRRKEREDDVRAHEANIRRAAAEVKRDAQIWVGAANVEACADRSRPCAAPTVAPPTRRSPLPRFSSSARSAAIARLPSAILRRSTRP